MGQDRVMGTWRAVVPMLTLAVLKERYLCVRDSVAHKMTPLNSLERWNSLTTWTIEPETTSPSKKLVTMRDGRSQTQSCTQTCCWRVHVHGIMARHVNKAAAVSKQHHAPLMTER